MQPLTQRNIPVVTAIYFCTRFHLYIHVYALLLGSRGLSLLQISTIESLVTAAVFLFEVPTGVLADRAGRRWSLAAGVGLLCCGELLFLFSRSYALYLLVALFTGAGFACMSGAAEALIYDSLPGDATTRERSMQRVMGRYHSAGQIAFFLAPLVGAVIVGDLSPERFDLAIALTAGILLIGLLLCAALREPPAPWQPAQGQQRPNSRAIFRAGLGELLGNRPLRRLVLLVVLTTPFTGTLVTTLAAPTLTERAVPPFAIALALSLGSLGAALAQRYAYLVERVLGRRRAFWLLTLLPGAAYLLLALTTGGLSGWLLIVWLYATNDLRAPLVSAVQNAQIASATRATVLSLMNMLLSLFVALLAPLYAALATRSLPLAFGVIGGVILTAGLLALPRLGIDR